MKTDTRKILNQGYDDLAPLSRRWRKEFRLHKHTLDAICKYLPDTKDKSALDIGCGLGVLTRALAILGMRAEGVDKHILVEWGNMDEIKKVWEDKGVKITIGDFLDAEFTENSFDCIVSEDLFEHLRYTQCEFLEKTYKLLRPGGYMFLATPNLASVLKRACACFGKSVYWDLEDFFLRKQPFGHVREFTAKELKRMAEIIGFEVREIKSKNIYFNKKWLFNLGKIFCLVSFLLSFLFPYGKDVLFIVARKPARA